MYYLVGLPTTRNCGLYEHAQEALSQHDYVSTLRYEHKTVAVSNTTHATQSMWA